MPKPFMRNVFCVGVLRDVELHVVFERGDIDRAAEYRGGDGDRHVLVDIGAVAHEALMRLYADAYMEVALGTAPQAVVAAAGDADRLPVVDAGGYLYLALLDVPHPSAAAARLAGILYNAASAVTR